MPTSPPSASMTGTKRGQRITDIPSEVLAYISGISSLFVFCYSTTFSALQEG